MSTDTRAHVEPGGPAWTSTLTGPIDQNLPATVTKFSVSEMDNNVYLVACETTGAIALIDAADDAARIIEVAGSDARVEQIVTTHRHWDHHRALVDVAEHYGAPTAAGAPDAAELPVTPDRELLHGDTITIGHLTLEVVALRGHTPGSVALVLNSGTDQPVIFTGDSLFPGGPGKTDGAAEFTQLIADLEARVFDRFGDTTVVHPGHGDSTTLGAERDDLTSWRDRGW